MEELTLEKFEEASDLVREVTTETKLVYSEYFSSQTGNKVYFKPENMQYTGAYKVRGAYYKISTLSGDEKAKGLITASAGNHAQGVAYAAKLAGVKATVVMPTTTPLMKVNRTKSYGAEVVLEGDVFDEACDYAYKLADEQGLTFVHPFDDLAVATGQGTIAMEIIKELPTVDYILVPIGGGGLCTGVSTLAKLLNPKIKIIGVEPAGRGLTYGDHAASLCKGEPGVMHGFHSYMIKDENGEPGAVYSISAGLDYPSVGPEHSYLKDIGRAEYVSVTDKEAVDAFFLLSRTEGIIPALESSHALAQAVKVAPTLPKDAALLVCLSGRGDKDVEQMEAFLESAK